MRYWLAVAAIVLAACAYEDGSAEAQEVGDRVTLYIEVERPDGGIVPCVIFKWGYAGGVSCDWSDR
jgi:hypothetical protein